MGFAQKFGDFTEGFTGGLLPGLQTGARIAGQRQTRALAQKREKRLLEQHELGVIYNMAKTDLSGAISMAESLGDPGLAASLRRRLKGNVKTGALTALQGAPAPQMSAIIDYSPEGLRQAAEDAQAAQTTTQQGIAGIDTALGSVPPGFTETMGQTPELEALAERRSLLEDHNQRLGARVRGLALVQAQLTGIDYLSPSWEDSISGVVNAYVEATGNLEGGDALRRGLNKTARDARYETWSKIISGLNGDEEGLENLLAEPAVTEDPRLFELVSYLHSSAKRTAGMSPQEQEIQTQAKAEAQFLWGLAENTTDPSAAKDMYERALEAFQRAGMPQESIDSMREQIPKFVREIGNRTRDDFAENIIKAIAQGAANYKDPIVTLREIGSVYGITVPEGIKLSSPEGQSIVKSISDAAYETVRGSQQPEEYLFQEPAPLDPTKVPSSPETVPYNPPPANTPRLTPRDSTLGYLLALLEVGDTATANAAFNAYISQQGMYPSMYSKILDNVKNAGYMWVPSPVGFMGGEFKKIEPNPVPAPTPQGTPQASPSPQGAKQDTAATAPFLGG